MTRKTFFQSLFGSGVAAAAPVEEKPKCLFGEGYPFDLVCDMVRALVHDPEGQIFTDSVLRPYFYQARYECPDGLDLALVRNVAAKALRAHGWDEAAQKLLASGDFGQVAVLEPFGMMEKQKCLFGICDGSGWIIKPPKATPQGMRVLIRSIQCPCRREDAVCPRCKGEGRIPVMTDSDGYRLSAATITSLPCPECDPLVSKAIRILVDDPNRNAAPRSL